jgi:shikimate dehydrogenase
LKEEEMINNDTRLLGLMGETLGHSFSAFMHNRAYERENLNYIYINMETEKKNIGEILNGIKYLKFDGFNVTIPYKIDIMNYMDEIDPLAEKIGSVNTVKIEDGRFKGYNTDGEGFVISLAEECNFDCRGKKVLILGSGGASRAVSMTIADKNPEKIYITNRTLQKAVDLSDEINYKFSEICFPVDSVNLDAVIEDCDLLINTTSVGMHPNEDMCPIDLDLLHEGLTVCDIIYNPEKTMLLIEAEKLGCKTMNGIGMLVNQGAKAFEIWTDKKAPIELMRESLKLLLDSRKK